MNNHAIANVDVVATVLPQQVVVIPDANKQYADLLAKLLDIKERGHQWIRTYEIPGRKLLRKIVAEAYAVYLSIEQNIDNAQTYVRLTARLRADKVRMHSDAPRSMIVVRTVFPTLDPSRISKYARAMDAAKQNGVSAEKFETFVTEAGGFEKIRLAPVLVLVPSKPAKAEVPASYKSVVPPVGEEEEDDLNDEEIDELEFGDELYELLEKKRPETPLASAPLTQRRLRQR